MSIAKLEFSLGGLSFAGEGEQEWLSKQLDKLLEKASQLSKSTPPGEIGKERNGEHSKRFTKTLASYIKEKGGDKVQVDRFLATADWLRQRGEKLETSAVTKALSDNHQKRLGNPADCLNKNIAKGFCEKQGDGFFITPDGLAHLGHK